MEEYVLSFSKVEEDEEDGGGGYGGENGGGGKMSGGDGGGGGYGDDRDGYTVDGERNNVWKAGKSKGSEADNREGHLLV